MNEKDVLIMDKILLFEDKNGKDWQNYDDKKSTFLNELGVNKERYQIYINEISKFSDSVTPICHTYNPYDDNSYPKFDCDESTKKFIEDGGFAGHYKIKKVMYNLDEILNEYLDVLAAHYPGGIRPGFDFFNNKPYDYLTSTVIEKGLAEDLIEWMGTLMKLSTHGYETIQKNGNYLNSLNSAPNLKGESKYNKNEMDEKIDKLAEGILRNEMGAEIIFDELQELKELVSVLNKKNWEQVLKGKLFDLAANKGVGLGLATAKHIFTDLTGKSIDKLLS